MKRITVKLIGENGNAFNLIAIVRKALIKNGQDFFEIKERLRQKEKQSFST